MAREKTTVYIEEDLARAARAFAARTGREEREVFEEALRGYLGFDELDRVWRREGLPGEEEATRLAYEELHAMRAEKRDAGGGSASSTG